MSWYEAPNLSDSAYFRHVTWFGQTCQCLTKATIQRFSLASKAKQTDKSALSMFADDLDGRAAKRFSEEDSTSRHWKTCIKENLHQLMAGR